jgi:hypothetical protein
VTSNHHVVSWKPLAEERMSADCNCAGSSVPLRKKRGVRVGSWLGLAAGIAATLAPKCPLCLAAYLSMVGIGVGLAKVAPMLFPFGVVLASIAFVSLVRSRRHPVSPQLVQSTQQERNRP